MADVQLKHNKHVGVSFALDGNDLVATVTPASVGAVELGADVVTLNEGLFGKWPAPTLYDAAEITL